MGKRGITAEQVSSATQNSEEYSNIPCYFGAAPIWQVDDSEWKSLAGKAVLLKNQVDAKKKIGYLQPESGKWPKYASLCEAVYLHFMRDVTYGPIAVILNGAEITESEEKTAEVTIANGKGTLKAQGKAVLYSVAIDEKTKGEDYKAYYDDLGQNIVIEALSDEMAGTVSVQYTEVSDVDEMTMSKVFENIDYIQQDINVIPIVLAAPGWEAESYGESTVEKELRKIAEGKINNHWKTQAYTQLYDKTKESAMKNISMKSHKVKVCWPFAKIDGLVVHLSSIYVMSKLLVDAENDGVPYMSGSNEIIDVDSICDEEGNLIRLKEADSNELNEMGIATVNFLNGSWRTWGIRMSNYREEEADNIDKAQLTDVAVQMLDYVCNDFQHTYVDLVDKAISEKDAKDMAENYQTTKLDVMVNSGQLLYGKIILNKGDEDYNVAAGDFVFLIDETSTPPGNSITAKVRYSDIGLEPSEEE